MTKDTNQVKSWTIIIDILRLGTPVLLAVLSYLFLGFQATLQDNTKAVNEVAVQIAVISERLKRVETDYDLLRSEIVKTQTEVQVLKEKFIKLETNLK